MFPPTLLCGAVLLNVTLRKCVLCLQEAKDKEGEATPTETTPTHSSPSKDLEVSECLSLKGPDATVFVLTRQKNRVAVLEICEQLDVFKACEAVSLNP